MTYIPHTNKDIKDMLKVIGKESLEELYNYIPEEIRLKSPYKVPEKLTEMALTRFMENLSKKNKISEENLSFLGAGAYEHFIPTLVDFISSRSEFWTSYTPYQPETSQGNLQIIFEYQTSICELTGLDISNASLYDGPSALAEALLIAHAHFKEKKNTILLPETLHPEYKETVTTYLKNLDIKYLPEKNGCIDIDKLKEMLNENVAAVVVQTPNFYGVIEDAEEISKIVHEKKSMLISVVNPISLGLLISPGEYNADIAVGEGQPLGIPLNYGGPYFGFMACKKDFLRRMPGRIVGETVDGKGDRGFVLTLQTREQHIRRERATSNICTNQGLMALRGLIYLCCVGKQGFQDIAKHCVQKAHYLANKINEIDGIELSYDAPFFNEFLVKCKKSSKEILEKLLKKNIFAGISINKWFPDRNNEILIAVTETKTKEDLDTFVEELKKVILP